MFLSYSFTKNSEQKNSFRTHRKAIIEAVYLGVQNWDETGRNDGPTTDDGIKSIHI